MPLGGAQACTPTSSTCKVRGRTADQVSRWIGHLCALATRLSASHCPGTAHPHTMSRHGPPAVPVDGRTTVPGRRMAGWYGPLGIWSASVVCQWPHICPYTHTRLRTLACFSAILMHSDVTR